MLTVGIRGQYFEDRLTEVIEPARGLVIMLTVLTWLDLLFVPAAETGLWELLAVSFVPGFALFAMQPMTQPSIAKYSLSEARSLSVDYTYLAIFGIVAFGAVIVGTVLTYGSVAVLFIVLAGFAVTGGLLAVILVTRE